MLKAQPRPESCSLKVFISTYVNILSANKTSSTLKSLISKQASDGNCSDAALQLTFPLLLEALLSASFPLQHTMLMLQGNHAQVATCSNLLHHHRLIAWLKAQPRLTPQFIADIYKRRWRFRWSMGRCL